MFEVISVEEYGELLGDFDASETIMLAGCWPISVGVHRDLGSVALIHCGEVAAIVTPPPVVSG